MVVDAKWMRILDVCIRDIDDGLAGLIAIQNFKVYRLSFFVQGLLTNGTVWTKGSGSWIRRYLGELGY